METELVCDISITDWDGGNLNSLALKPNKNYLLTIDYPLDNKAQFQVFSTKTGMTFELLIAVICTRYFQIYEQPKLYGIWGHSIHDLYIERITINHQKKTITLGMGS